MDTLRKGSDLLSARVIAVTGLIAALGNLGLCPIAVVLVCIALVIMLK
ncbi:hypothetical protein ESCOMA059M_09800 [Escherichia coli]|uniref:Uncharacterized protein n=1 Tax=Escherichia coli TaxID=562 RepID=A0A3P5DUF0_ECOLX|nr:hypothetical protein FM728_003159 [Escherichia coli]SJC02022.1 Uncharacterised protein [Shigella sonnei]MCN7436266.1 hypothetical protein [Escherichia coli]SJJ16851.1 Uncharacterised protein [Shigella sonnei]SJJ36964.1 Uncharacterised protein [Shigella sonnei]